jgi:hypothetical protein
VARRPLSTRSAATPQWFEVSIGGEQVEDEVSYDATSIAAMRIGCQLPN